MHYYVKISWFSDQFLLLSIWDWDQFASEFNSDKDGFDILLD